MRYLKLSKLTFAVVTAAMISSFYVPQALAEKISVEELKKIQKKLKAIPSLQVKFKQTVYTTLRKKQREFSGTAYFAQPGKFRWVQEKNTPKEIVFGGTDLVIYTPEDKIASSYGSLGGHVKEYQKLTSFVLSLDDLLSQYDLVAADHDKVKKLVTMEIKPKAKALDIEKVKLQISLAENFVKEVLLNYKEGNWTLFQFSAPVMKPLPPEKFVFTKPPGVKLEVFQ